jgi:hypothetical protein
MPGVHELILSKEASHSLFEAGRQFTYLCILLSFCFTLAIKEIAKREQEANASEAWLESMVDHLDKRSEWLIQNRNMHTDVFASSDSARVDQLRVLAMSGYELVRQLVSKTEAAQLAKVTAQFHAKWRNMKMFLVRLFWTRVRDDVELLLRLDSDILYGFKVEMKDQSSRSGVFGFRAEYGQAPLPGQKFWPARKVLSAGIMAGSRSPSTVKGLLVTTKVKLDHIAVRSSQLNTMTEVMYPICYEDICDEDEGCHTKCKHRFHGECLRLWANTNLNTPRSTCPSCRTILCLRPGIEVFKAGRDPAVEPENFWLEDEAEFWIKLRWGI